MDNQICAYCGEEAEQRDHLIPHSYNSINAKNRTFSRNEVVPACRECNATLHNIFLPTVPLRARYLATCYRRRYRKLLTSPRWSDTDREGMGEAMLTLIDQTSWQQRRAQARLTRLDEVSKEQSKSAEEYWDGH